MMKTRTKELQTATSPSSHPDLAEVPLSYFEQLIHLSMGTQVSKMTLGFEPLTQDSPPAAGMTIAMPTNSLIMLAKSILAAYNDPANQLRLQEIEKKAKAMLLAETSLPKSLR